MLLIAPVIRLDLIIPCLIIHLLGTEAEHHRRPAHDLMLLIRLLQNNTVLELDRDIARNSDGRIDIVGALLKDQRAAALFLKLVHVGLDQEIVLCHLVVSRILQQALVRRFAIRADRICFILLRMHRCGGMKHAGSHEYSKQQQYESDASLTCHLHLLTSHFDNVDSIPFQIGTAGS